MSIVCEGAPRQPARLVLLEDDGDLRAILLDLFTTEGLDVAVCDSYASLREAMRACQRMVVVADFWGASHTALSPSEREQIREIGRVAPTILLTGRAWASATTAEELSIVGILPKPVMLEELLEQVLRCLEPTQTL